MANLFVTGSTGFIGKRLIPRLLQEGHTVYALSRIAGTKGPTLDHPNLHYIFGDLRDPATVEALPKNLDAAYYLVHSMSEIGQNLEQVEADVATCFVKAITKTSVTQIIYLGGILNDEKRLSPHLKSRLIVESILKKSGIHTTVLRASIILGAGSASFEIVRDLTEKLPIMIAPKWLLSPCQPIAIHDVLFYLIGVLLNPRCYDKVFDIGGPDILTFKELLLAYAACRNLKRYIISVPVLSPRISSYWLVFITSVRFSICYYLVESMKTPSICTHKEINTILPRSCMPVKTALEQALEDTAESTWMDSWEVEGITPNIQTYTRVPKEGCFKDIQRFQIKGSKDEAIGRIFSIGGTTGYHALDWAWRLRGLLDKMVGGVGLNRGRRSPTDVEVGESIDFWRVVEADKSRGILTLFAGMRVPGEAWLQFIVTDDDLVQTATFRPKGLWGRIYWYLMLPFHFLIFRKMAKALAEGS